MCKECCSAHVLSILKARAGQILNPLISGIFKRVLGLLIFMEAKTYLLDIKGLLSFLNCLTPRLNLVVNGRLQRRLVSGPCF